MTRRQVEVAGERRTIAPLEPPAAIDRSCALMRIRVRDEITDQAPRTTVSARLTRPMSAGASARVIDAGLIGVSGRATSAFAPTLATTGRIEVEVSAPNFTPRRVAVDFACALRRLTAAAAGAVLTLNSNAGLQAGQRLLLSSPSGGQVEFGLIAATGPGANQVTLTRAASFPLLVDSFAQPLPADQSLDLHHAPVSIRGRILKKTGTTVAPLANAEVRILKLWRRLPRAGTTTPPEPPVPGPVPAGTWAAPIASLWPPAYSDAAAGATLRIEDRGVDAAMSAKRSLDDLPLGATELRVSNRVNLNPNDLLLLDADDPGRREMLLALTVTGSTTSSDDWARVTLNQPLAFGHRRGAVIRRLGSPTVATSVPINYSCARGDEVLLFDAATFTGIRQVCLDPGTPAARSFHRLTQFITSSDAEGFYRLPPLMRAGKVSVLAKDSGSTATREVEFIPDYDSSENQLDITV